MEITQFGPDDQVPLRATVDVANAAIGADAPWSHPATLTSYAGMLRHGWDGEPSVPFLATVDGTPVAWATYNTSEWDNTHLAWLGIEVHPAHRLRGHGSVLMDFLVDRARSEGRTSVGIDGWDSDAARAFAARHGLEKKSQSLNRRQLLADVDPDLVKTLWHGAAELGSAYELIRRSGLTLERDLPALTRMASAINDAPTDDLDIEDEVFTTERTRNFETCQLARGFRLHRVVARHRESGELAGHTVVLVEAERPAIGHQEDTSVVRSHRGHRLGQWLKADMLRWLGRIEPQLETIDTWNAESNDHMIEVNDRLGYRVLGRSLQFQRSLQG
ncbi:GNAT family N-acetyltransferase [Nocardioides jensenii]|uniref:GNAT family N-acetyltransferase n=1 Tax=Nocardioides jensenii TaxID=1843 RepID=UPI00082AF7E7|nr:GNAT family N-acetyltransferase [Nocardioides jensenii]